MRNITKITILAALLLLVGAPVYAQTVLTPTTLSAAVSSGSIKTIVVASATGFTAGQTVAYVDRELMNVLAVNGTTITVARGMNGTAATPHASGAYVFVGVPQAFSTSTPAGSCTRSNELYLPKIDTKTGYISDCLGGQWVAGDVGTAPLAADWKVKSPDPGATAYTGINTNGTTPSATTMYCSELNLPHSKLLTGLGVLNGTTVGTDKHLVALYDSGGKLLANSAVAGATSAGASAYQDFAFTSVFFAVGPARYFGCVQTNGTTDTIRMAVTGQADTILTKGQTGITFGTIPSLTVPATFTTAVGPFVYAY